MNILSTLNYSPPANGAIVAVMTATFDCETGQPIDFGASCSYLFRVTQSGVTRSSPGQRLGRARARYVLDWTTTIDPSAPVVFELAFISGVVTTVYAATFKVEIIKR